MVRILLGKSIHSCTFISFALLASRMALHPMHAVVVSACYDGLTAAYKPLFDFDAGRYVGELMQRRLELRCSEILRIEKMNGRPSSFGLA